MKQKYYIRGLGIGILITTILFILVKPSGPSDEEIIKRAEELGYVKVEEDVTPTINLEELMKQTPAPSRAATDTPKPTETPTPTTTPQETLVPLETLVPSVTLIPEETLPPTPKATNIPRPTPTTAPKETLVPQETTVPEETLPPVSTVTNTPVPTPTQKPEMIEIKIPAGTSASEVCRMMQRAGIISDWMDLRNYMVEHNLTNYIRIGTFKVHKGMTYEELSYAVTGRR